MIEKEVNFTVIVWFIVWLIQLLFTKLKYIPSPLITIMVLWIILYTDNIFPKNGVFIQKITLLYLLLTFIPITIMLYTTNVKDINMSIIAFLIFMSIYFFITFLMMNNKKDRLYYELLENNNKDISQIKGTLESLSRDDVKGLIEKYYPIHYLNNDSPIYPVNIEQIAQHYKKEIRGGETYLILNENLSSSNDKKPWIYGNENNLDDTYTYIFLRPHPEGFGLFFNVIFQYNLGKRVISSRIGSHYYDSTQSYIIFDKDKNPKYIGCQSHSSRFLWKWKDNNSLNEMYDTRNKNQEFIDEHPIFYHAKDGNEVYPFSGNYTYENKIIFTLRDNMNKGKEYHTGKKYVLLSQDNYYGVENSAIDNNNNSISLSIPNLDIQNWSRDVRYIGNDKIGKILFTEIYMLSGPIYTKWSEYKDEELKYKFRTF